MNQKKTIYYIAFPAFVFLLCLFSYKIGYNRGEARTKQEQISRVLEELEKTETEPSKLTYYQELHDDKNPIVKQINENKDKKALPATTPTNTLVVEASVPTKDKPTEIIKTPDLVKKTTDEKTGASLQVGAFTDLGKADELTDRLKNSGFDAYTKPIQSKGSELFRVLVRSSKADVTNIQSRLSEQGYKNTFVVSR